MSDKKIFVVTNRKLIIKENLAYIIDKASLGGTDAVILREKDLSYTELLSLAEGIKKITDSRKVSLIINGNIDVAIKINAAGFHTSYKNFIESFKHNKEKFNENNELSNFEHEKKQNALLFKGIKGASVHSIYEAIDAASKGADYLLAGHVFETDCKKGIKGRGISFISEICRNVSIPVIAIGGINEFNAAEAIKSGASGIAVMSSIMSANDPKEQVLMLRNSC